MRIAVIGGGISGLSAAWFLKDEHQITLFEKSATLGGHAHTEVITVDGKKVPVDTAFIVLNKRNYPNLVAFFEALGVPIDLVNMVLSVSLDDGEFEWSTKRWDGVFADRRNALRPSFWSLLFEVVRFNKVARAELPRLTADETLGSFLDRHTFGPAFRRQYLYPLTGAIWSTPAAGIEASPAKSVLGFLDNHGTLRVDEKDRLDWYTVHGGSHEYVKTIAQDLRQRGHKLRTRTSVEKVLRSDSGVHVITAEGKEEFDYIIFAAHANTTLALLDKPSSQEQRLLSPFAYERNEVYLHTDEAFMPRRKRAWGTWVYAGEPEELDGSRKTSITYYMNALQHLDTGQPIFVTLNPHTVPAADKTYKHYTYHHPIYSPAAIQAQPDLEKLQGKQRSLFCGSYFGFGFHEDGITSAIAAVGHLGVRPPWAH